MYFMAIPMAKTVDSESHRGLGWPGPLYKNSSETGTTRHLRAVPLLQSEALRFEAQRGLVLGEERSWIAVRTEDR